MLGLIASAYCRAHLNSVMFLSTTSPDGSYEVRLKGDTSRTLIIPHEVRADVVKSGKPLVSDVFIHSTHNPFDLSFEAGFPDARWLGRNTLEFYRQEYFGRGSDSLVIKHNGKEALKCLRIHAVNKFLVFDLEPGSSISVQIPAARGNSQSIAVEGAFRNDQKIGFQQRSFDRRSDQQTRSNYQIQITDSDIKIAEGN